MRAHGAGEAWAWTVQSLGTFVVVFSAADIGALAAAGILILAFPYVRTQVGLAAGLIVGALVVQRALADKSRFWGEIAAWPTR
jgi:hypothetical protein